MLALMTNNMPMLSLKTSDDGENNLLFYTHFAPISSRS